MKQDKYTAANPVALITGTSSGFGLLTALELAERGYLVVAGMRDLSRSDELRQKAKAAGVEKHLHYVELDVTDEAEIEEVVTGTLQTYGRIDVLVNNAGFAVGGFTEEIPMEDWRSQLETNFFGLVAVTKAVLPAMRQRGAGHLINVGSVSGLVGFPGYAPYAASKFAVEGFSESLRHELSGTGVKVVLVEPGSFKTPIWDKGLQNIRRQPDSPYASRLEAVLRYSRKSAETAPDPVHVARLIGRITAMSSPRLRYRIGQGSTAMIWSKTLLPWKWLEWMLRKALGGK
ncbi:SDR family oxidoreductase [Paenibacillus sp. GCM10012307]|uniref:SDR family oxidoreductase n=1 Tax=Paenibacillus roseus TaxID=2798579 RepID=A0A934J5E0_9BACL|nr:SDR family oxidoreductase [Paenibacillus roseus]MBJ6360682.1 SDR family oxidoreductase [Paenibacillus roseus]